MSNHSGSYMLNRVLQLLEEEGVLGSLGPERAQQIVLSMVRISQDYDCNPGEILEGLGERLGICYGCLKPKTDLDEYGQCRACLEWTPVSQRTGAAG